MVKDRTRILKALETMPREAFDWFVLATAPASRVAMANAQIWPDGLGGFTAPAQAAIVEIRAAAAEYVLSVREEGLSSPDRKP